MPRNRRRAAVLVALTVTFEAPRVAADPYVPAPLEVLHLKTSSTARTDGGTDLRLPPGYFLDEKKYEAVDDELRILQDERTRLKAENASLRASADDGISFGWYALGTALVLGFAGGYYVSTKL